MAGIGVIAGVIGAGLNLIGSFAAANAQKQQGEAERQAAYYKAQQEERRAMQERAVAGVESRRQRRETSLLQSQLQARAASSGGGAGLNDPSVISLASGIEGEGEYRALSQMWLGETRGRNLEDQANLDRFVGDQRKRAADASAKSTILGGFGGLFGSLARFG